MKKLKLVLWPFAILCAVIAIVFVMRSERALLMHPKGLIAQSELRLMTTNTLLMLIVVVPTFVFLFFTAWKYSANNAKTKHNPEASHHKSAELILWIIPSIIIAIMMVITWKATHELDPYKPIASENKPLTIQVVALDWKWLFIYPEQGIATVNFMQFPEQTPIHLSLSADGSPMNSFWLPQLSGQIYAMTGMTTTLHIMADAPGVYTGRAAEINGKGFADMTFIAKSTTQTDFENWVESAKQTPLQLTDDVYRELVKPSQNNPITVYSYVEKDFFNQIVWKTSSSEN